MYPTSEGNQRNRQGMSASHLAPDALRWNSRVMRAALGFTVHCPLSYLPRPDVEDPGRHRRAAGADLEQQVKVVPASMAACPLGKLGYTKTIFQNPGFRSRHLAVRSGGARWWHRS